MRVVHQRAAAMPRGAAQARLPVGVAQGEWASGQGMLVTEGVVTCVVLAACNGRTGHGVLGHFSAISPLSQRVPWLANEVCDTRAFLDAVHVLPALGPVSQLHVWLGGATTHAGGPGVARIVRAEREFAFRSLRRLLAAPETRPATLIVDWNATPNELVITLDSTAGRLLISQACDE